MGLTLCAIIIAPFVAYLLGIKIGRMDASEESTDEIIGAVKKQTGVIMSVIGDFAKKQEAFNTRLEKALQGISGDIADLNILIADLQESSGEISPQDQASLDAIQAKGDELAKKAEDIDGLTPPAPPLA